MYFCLDEAQADIDAQIRTVDGTVSLLKLWARRFFFGKSRRAKYSPVSYSGTSLSTEEAVKAVKYGGFTRQSDEDGSSHTSDCEIFSNFPAIRGEEQLKEVIKEHGMTMIEQSGKEAIEMIVEHARPFYGRPAWSIRYLEHVNAVLPADSLSSLSASALREKMAKAADDAMKEVKGDLKNRLHQLHDQGLEKLMEDLCRVAVWSDLLDGPKPFFG